MARAKNGTVPRYFDANYKNSYQKMRDRAIAAETEVARLRSRLEHLACKSVRDMPMSAVYMQVQAKLALSGH